MQNRTGCQKFVYSKTVDSLGRIGYHCSLKILIQNAESACRPLRLCFHSDSRTKFVNTLILWSLNSKYVVSNEFWPNIHYKAKDIRTT